MRSLGRFRPSPALLVAVAATVVALGGVAWAVIPDRNGVISACYSTANGSLRVIDTERGQACKANETPLSWNQRGPRGLPGKTPIVDATTVTDTRKFASCTWLGPKVTLTVQSPGTIVVQATSALVIDQTGYATPQSDYVALYITPSPGVCDADPGHSQAAFDPVDQYVRHIITLPSQRTFRVSSAGTYSAYLNGIMFFGRDDSDYFDHGTMTAVFYPDP